MIDKRIKNFKYAELPQFKEKYVVIDGQVYINLCREPGSICVARFVRSAENGKDLRNR